MIAQIVIMCMVMSISDNKIINHLSPSKLGEENDRAQVEFELPLSTINAALIEHIEDMVGEIAKNLDSQEVSSKMGDKESKVYCFGHVMATYKICKERCKNLESTYQSIQCATWDLASYLTSCITGSMVCYAKDTNECLDNNGGCTQICQNTDGSFSCSCLPGYSLINDGKSCIDINECLENNGGCGQLCTNNEGLYNCSCRAGYSLSSNNMDCIDINECEFYNGECAQVCKNTDGSFNCECNPGNSMSIDGITCIVPCSDEFLVGCPDGSCIEPYTVCDLENNCSDGADERDCQNRTCDVKQFRCSSGKCISQSWRCDGSAECPDGDDEQGC